MARRPMSATRATNHLRDPEVSAQAVNAEFFHTPLPVRASQTPSQDAPEPRNSVMDLPF
jgi:hypothetical protein